MTSSFLPSSATFRKLFPEYVEKYYLEQQQQQPGGQPDSDMEPEIAQDENSRPKPEKVDGHLEEDAKRVDAAKDARRNKRKQTFPAWVVILLVSIFGIVMALPLLQLSHP
ncbi:unnamed protein product [Linum trigynum]|uniref:Uncharacterized protein n=1 Tax=Linum trigynum TaxID=586398 RepID=A0AAV2FMQ1_9ROSI